MSLSTTRAGTVFKRVLEMKHENQEPTEGPENVGVDNQRQGVEEVTPQVGVDLPQVGGEQANGGVSAIMQMFMEERRQRQAEQAEERRKWEMERRIRDEEIARKDEYNMRQMETLQSLVQGVQS